MRGKYALAIITVDVHKFYAGQLACPDLLNEYLIEESVMNHQRVIELRAGEGGADSRRFVAELADAYLRLSTRKG